MYFCGSEPALLWGDMPEDEGPEDLRKRGYMVLMVPDDYDPNQLELNFALLDKDQAN